MQPIICYDSGEQGLSEHDILSALSEMRKRRNAEGKKTLILPPDYTRLHSGAGYITGLYYKYIQNENVDILPALGTHESMTDAEISSFFGAIPKERFLTHDWRDGVDYIGRIPAGFIKEVSEGILDEEFPVELSRHITRGGYQQILSVGQVVPHEVAGLANYSKNLLIGVGGSRFINKSHILGALYGMERIMGRADNPVRRVFDYAQQHFLSAYPIVYILTVTTNTPSGVKIHGLFIGDTREVFEKAAELSIQKNMISVEEPFKKVVVNLDEREFKSTWLGNKAIYRTRMAIADGGELIILAKGVRQFGEDRENDRLIRKYGYVGRENIIRLYRENDDLQQNQSVAAHLVHGSSDGRFNVTYATHHLTEAEVRGAGFNYMPYSQAAKLYNPEILQNGYNTVNGESIFYIDNPALGLWKYTAD